MHVGRKRYTAIAAVAVATLVSAVGCSSSKGSSASPKLASTVAAACQAGATEGTVNYWVSYDADTFKKEIAPFEQQYPKIKIVQGVYHGTDITPKVSAEAQARHAPSADLIEADIPSLSPLVTANLVQNIDWTQYGLPSDQLSGGSGVQGIRTYRIPGGIAYNTKLVQASQLPDTWDGLINSQWAGKIIYDPRGDYLENLAVPWGTAKAQTWLNGFIKTDKPVPVKGSTASLQQVASGQSLISTSATVDNVQQLSATGAPLAIKYLDIVPTLDYYAYVVKGAAHPNAAVCFMSWWAGQQGVAQRVKYENKPNDTRPNGLPASSQVVSLTNSQSAQLATTFATALAATAS
jgi:ABC-type Fe3+ transport system substrate-binding protein